MSFVVPRGAKTFVVIFAALCAEPAAAGALLMDEGAGEIIVTSTFADANKAYDRHGHLIRTPSYGKFEAAGYVEYGVTNWLTVVAEGSAFDFNGSATAYAFEPAPHYAGAGLGSLGGRIRLGEFAASISARRPAFASHRMRRGSSSTSRRRRSSTCAFKPCAASRLSGCRGSSRRSSATGAAARAATRSAPI